VYCVIKRGEFLGSEKTVHIPKIPIGSTTLSKLDEEKIRTAIQLKVDVILVPGVRNSVFFDHVRKFVSKLFMKSLWLTIWFFLVSSITIVIVFAIIFHLLNIILFFIWYQNMLHYIRPYTNRILSVLNWGNISFILLQISFF